MAGAGNQGGDVAAASMTAAPPTLFEFAVATPRPSTSATPRKKGKSKKMLPPPQEKPEQLQPQVQYTDQLTGLLGQERRRLAQQILVAAEKGNKKAVYLLLHQRLLAPSDCIGMQGFSPLHHAASRGHLEIAQLLLSFGWPLDHINQMGETALHLASHGGHVHVVECFLDKGAHVNAVNADHETALFYAARKGHFRIVRLLLRRDADAALRNRFDDVAEDDAKDDLTRQEFTASKDDQARLQLPHHRHDGDAGLRAVHRESIFAFLDTRSLGLVMQVCFRWQRAADTPRLWTSLGVSRWELSLNKTVGLGFIAPMTGYRPTPRRRPSTSGEDMLNTTGHLGFHKAAKKSADPPHSMTTGPTRTILMPARPQTAASPHHFR
ncbi:Aste57867_14849 [Aphanomyces stellatus]|uniref:Aste57867_14849 protein n=1 Tax=Aphanomyces stellatus TaxID=120398 RepID=A0A485L4E3_9STRA|nr:hypothetical protein As57867_014793 [Aphanomyces stellatus]VFT91667.1 Aste57867_14849 [Aphanomyces stellatus]